MIFSEGRASSQSHAVGGVRLEQGNSQRFKLWDMMGFKISRWRKETHDGMCEKHVLCQLNTHQKGDNKTAVVEAHCLLALYCQNLKLKREV